MYATRFTALLAAVLQLSEASVIPNQKRSWSVGQQVETTSGIVVGGSAPNKTEVSQYVGIPFAHPPVGELRWAAPKKFTSKNTINATTYSSDCAANVQSPDLATGVDPVVDPGALILLTSLMQLGNPTAEDCLTLNVWTKPQTGAAKKPVMFWIYGGGFNSGNTNNPVYDGEFLANNEDVVVVSTNYRLNVFGFPGVPGVPGMEQNPGLLDQRMAVEWVRDNIAKFGGDPERITIFGESAGGASVDFYNYAWTKDPIIAGSIAESGTTLSFADPNPNNNLGWWNDAAKKLSCPEATTSEAKKSVDCMRTKDTKALLDATFVPNQLQAVLGHFGPNVDEKVVFSDYKKRAAEGNFIKKPYMAGSNENEAGLFILIAKAAKLVLRSPDKLWSTFNTAVFNCPASWATTAREAAGVLTYRYRYFGDYMNSRLLENPSSGAWHTAEIPMIFGTVESTTAEPNSEIEEATSKFMMKMWASFARDPKSLQTEMGLPTFNPNQPSIIALGSNNVTHQIIDPIQVDGTCIAVDSIKGSIPGGIGAAIMSAAAGGDFGIPDLTIDQLPDLAIPYPDPPKATT